MLIPIRLQNSPTGRDMTLACNGCKTATKQSATLTLIEGKRKAKMIAKGRFFCNQKQRNHLYVRVLTDYFGRIFL